MTTSDIDPLTCPGCGRPWFHDLRYQHTQACHFRAAEDSRRAADWSHLETHRVESFDRLPTAHEVALCRHLFGRAPAVLRVVRYVEPTPDISGNVVTGGWIRAVAGWAG